MDAGYKKTTANKWLLNWAVSKCLRFEKDHSDSVDDYRIRLGFWPDCKPTELLDGGKVWLPVKEIYINNGGKKGYSQGVLL